MDSALVMTAVVSVIVGFGVGTLSGLLGIGGGTLLVPVFKLGYALDSIACTATSLFTIIPTSVSGAISHIRNKTCIPKLGAAAGLGGAVTSPLGVYLATISPDWLIMAAAALIIGYSACNMLIKALKMPSGKKRAEQVSEANRRGAVAGSAEMSVDRVPPVPRLSRRQLLTGACIGLFAGVASGYVGVGGGFIMVPLMVSLIHAPMKLVSGTSLIAVMILSVPGVITQGLMGNVHWVAGIFVACGSIPGAFLGARLVPKVPERALRLLFGCFLMVAAVMLVLNQAGVMG